MWSACWCVLWKPLDAAVLLASTEASRLESLCVLVDVARQLGQRMLSGDLSVAFICTSMEGDLDQEPLAPLLVSMEIQEDAT